MELFDLALAMGLAVTVIPFLLEPWIIKKIHLKYRQLAEDYGAIEYFDMLIREADISAYEAKRCIRPLEISRCFYAAVYHVRIAE